MESDLAFPECWLQMVFHHDDCFLFSISLFLLLFVY